MWKLLVCISAILVLGYCLFHNFHTTDLPKNTSASDSISSKKSNRSLASPSSQGGGYEEFEKQYGQQILLHPIEVERIIFLENDAKKRSEYRCYYLKLLGESSPELALERFLSWPKKFRGVNELTTITKGLYRAEPELLRELVDNLPEVSVFVMADAVYDADPNVLKGSGEVGNLVELFGTKLLESLAERHLARVPIRTEESFLNWKETAEHHKLSELGFKVSWNYARYNPDSSILLLAENHKRPQKLNPFNGLLQGLSETRPDAAVEVASNFVDEKNEREMGDLYRNWLEEDSMKAGAWLVENHSEICVETIVHWLRSKNLEDQAGEWAAFLNSNKGGEQN
ncbi:hypothetical protein [Roseibacillus persicicus]|uniref:hypothetical protein n=1 Tax=Roseibacillus persicicus TaxID=454148 RepID=UPI00280CF904|nr:hypothetical protein [Roseibacillus persicicus]MDQ8191969.1 hypothetical protein [Roseibacillus persicicus]